MNKLVYKQFDNKIYEASFIEFVLLLKYLISTENKKLQENLTWKKLTPMQTMYASS